MRTYSVYIMASASGVLYTGITNNLERRVSEHQQKLVPGFTARYNVQKLVYHEAYRSVRVAIAREKQIKGWLRKRKVALIESVNPHWEDLSIRYRKPSDVAPPCHSERSEESLPIDSRNEREILRSTKRCSE